MVSIIVPVYNAEKTIEKCVKSILAQTVLEKEIILINDGSKDNSLEIMTELSERYTEVFVLDKPNGGASSARNAGLKVCHGEYIAFVDSDDYYLDHTYLSNMLALMKSDDAVDLVISGYTILSSNDVKEYNAYDKTLSIDVLARNYIAFREEGLLHSPSNKIFRKERVEVYFDECMTMGEDAVFVLEYLKKCQKVAFCQGCGYGYTFLNTSSTASFRKKTAYDMKQTNIYHGAIRDFWLSVLSEEETARNYIVLRTDAVIQIMYKIWSIKGKLRYFINDIDDILLDQYLPSYREYLPEMNSYQHLGLTNLILSHKSFAVKLYCLWQRIKEYLKKF